MTESSRVVTSAAQVTAALDVLLLDSTVQEVTLVRIARRLQLAVEARGMVMHGDAASWDGQNQ